LRLARPNGRSCDAPFGAAGPLDMVFDPGRRDERGPETGSIAEALGAGSPLVRCD